MAQQTGAGGSPTGLHLPTFAWGVIAIIVAIVIYHMLFKR